MFVVEFLMTHQRYQGKLSLRVVGMKSITSTLYYLQLKNGFIIINLPHRK